MICLCWAQGGQRQSSLSWQKKNDRVCTNRSGEVASSREQQEAATYSVHTYSVSYMHALCMFRLYFRQVDPFQANGTSTDGWRDREWETKLARDREMRMHGWMTGTWRSAREGAKPRCPGPSNGQTVLDVARLGSFGRGTPSPPYQSCTVFLLENPSLISSLLVLCPARTDDRRRYPSMDLFDPLVAEQSPRNVARWMWSTHHWWISCTSRLLPLGTRPVSEAS